MRELQKQSVEITKKYPFLDRKELRFIDLIEEVGELASAMMYAEEWKKGKHQGRYSREDVADALADVLFDLYILADLYGLDLDDEYKKMLARLQKRAEAGEFSQE